MENRFDEFLDQLKDVTPPPGLSDRVVLAVRRDRKKRRAFAGLLYAGLGLSAPAIFFSLRLFISDVSNSSLISLLGLAWTDSREVRSALGSWLIALVESVPIGSLAMALGALFLFCLLANRIFSGARTDHGYLKEAI